MATDYSPRARTLWSGDVDNIGLVDLVSRVARNVAAFTQWPQGLDADDAPGLMYQYVVNETVYSPDRTDQFIRTPHAFVRDGIGDCKSTAIFIGAMCLAAGWPVQLRFVALPGRDYFGHVYAIVAGVPVDPLLPYGREVLHWRAHTIDL